MPDNLANNQGLPQSNFAFLQVWEDLTELMVRAQSAEAALKAGPAGPCDPRIAGFYARNALEYMVKLVFDLDSWLTHPRHDTGLMSSIHDKGFKDNLPYDLFPKLKLIIKLGNEAVHG